MRGGSSGQGRYRTFMLVFAVTALGAVAWLSWPGEPSLSTRDGSVVTVTTSSKVAVIPSTAPTVAGPIAADKTMTRDAANERIDPPLDRLVAEASEDVRTLHDQIAQQDRTSGDGDRERQVSAALAALAGIETHRVICAGAICEVVGRAKDRPAFDNKIVAEQLAKASLSFGPVAFGAPDPTGRMLFVQYVNVETDPGV